MSTSYSPGIGLGECAVGDTGWGPIITASLSLLDAQNAVGDLAVQLVEVPSTTLNVKVSAGLYVDQAGTVTTYAGTSSFALTANNTNYLYLDLTSSGALTKSTSAFPATAHVRIASVVALASTTSTITDQRAAFTACGPYAEGVNLAFGTSTGTQVGTAASQKIGFWGATPVIQPASANQASITDSTGGTAGFTLAAVGATNSGDVSATINSDLASLARAIAAIRSALVTVGIIKGAA